MEIQISVRNLVEFILRSGDIDNRKTSSDNAMQEGGRIHRMIQRRMGADYHAEVFLRHVFATPDYEIRIEGRADGIIIQNGGELAQVPELTDTEILPAYRDRVTVTIDEIKGTYRDIHRMKEAVAVHVAQAKCYAYIYGHQMGLRRIRVRMTYCNMDTEEIRYFHFEYELEELEQWFSELMEQYRKWADFQFQWQSCRQQTIRELVFPFPYREGQKELATYVYQTIYHRRKLFIEAPTGVGKTLSTLFPSVKGMGEGLAEKIFYLTAKTVTATVAEEALSLLRKQGLRFKSVVLTARDKVCFMEERECNPESCPYAKGHYDRINDAIYDLLTHADRFDRETILDYAGKHQVCPFEMCLDMSLFADAVICDYNYLFDPHVCLKRFFADGSKAEYVFLVDEAHNLVDRGRDMYSATLYKEDFLTMKKLVKDVDMRIYRQLENCNHALLELKRECENYRILSEGEAEPFARSLIRLSSIIEDYLEDRIKGESVLSGVAKLHEAVPEVVGIHEDMQEGAAAKTVRKEILNFYFEVSHFLLIYDKLDENYVTYSQMEEDGRFTVRLLCVNPARNLQECMAHGRSTILFSATLLPIQYYKRLLGAQKGDYEIYAKTVFDPRRKGLFVAEDVTSKYSRRGEQEYYNIASYIHRIVSQRTGNYMIFFPSHVFLQKVYEIYLASFWKKEDVECLVQEGYMDEQSREDFLRRFEAGQVQDGTAETLLGFCVLGGIFSEGIDLKADRLIGALIVGTGLPQVCNEREILKKYFDGQGENGFDYAYKYPGMNKVLQAAGRVIRTVEDVGIVALLDERFLTGSYQRLFPREWEVYEQVSLERVGKRVERFWDEWLI